MAGLCKMMVIGNLGRDPELRFTQSGRAMCKFSLAVSRYAPNVEGDRKEVTEWFDITAWGRLAETTSEYLSKGRKVFVEGRFESRTWEGQDGQKRTGLGIVAENIVLLDRQPRPSDEGGSPSHRVEDLEADDIPF